MGVGGEWRPLSADWTDATLLLGLRLVNHAIVGLDDSLEGVLGRSVARLTSSRMV
jgi:hypothetical protein